MYCILVYPPEVIGTPSSENSLDHSVVVNAIYGVHQACMQSQSQSRSQKNIRSDLQTDKLYFSCFPTSRHTENFTGSWYKLVEVHRSQSW